MTLVTQPLAGLVAYALQDHRLLATWGIALRQIWGHEAFDDHNEDGPWLFNDAPREMRLRSVDKISELIESLGKKASEAAKKIQERRRK